MSVSKAVRAAATRFNGSTAWGHYILYTTRGVDAWLRYRCTLVCGCAGQYGCGGNTRLKLGDGSLNDPAVVNETLAFEVLTITPECSLTTRRLGDSSPCIWPVDCCFRSLLVVYQVYHFLFSYVCRLQYEIRTWITRKY